MQQYRRTPRRFGLRLLAALALSAAGAGASAQVEWSALSPAQRSALAPLERDWRSITPAQQQKWIEVANRQASLPPQERALQTERMAAWSRLSPQERAQARLNFQEARRLGGGDERAQRWESYNALPPEQRRALADRAAPGPLLRKEAPVDQKSNLVRIPAPAPAQPVGPSVVQRGGGATTNLVSKPPAPPLHQQAGLPKVTATPGFVDAATLLPQRGAQGAAVARPADNGKKKSDKQAP